MFWPNKLRFRKQVREIHIHYQQLEEFDFFVFVWPKYKKLNRINKLSLSIRLIIFYLPDLGLVFVLVEEEVFFGGVVGPDVFD